MAIEDAASLSVVLPQGTKPEEVVERLQLYEQIRRERAHKIQELSRQAGRDWVEGKLNVDSESFFPYPVVPSCELPLDAQLMLIVICLVLY